ncbi:uncharacterized protein LOC143065128 [Mytilus galloprovincialis]|uniref:uncharacterized protein LOC143065128 n=1 Tax=Mytilus galloprovincialis TaxID=29158 RepID=UPI003F7B89E3
MENSGLTEDNSVPQEGHGQTTAGLEVINIPLLHVDGSNNIALTRLLAQHGITLQTGLNDVQNGQLLSVNGVESLSQNNIEASSLIESTNQIVFTSSGNVENQISTNDGLPIVGNQMLCVPNMTQTLTFVTDYMPDVVANGNLPSDNFHNNISLQYRIQSYEPYEEKKIFSHVVAFLSEDICAEMFTNHSGYLDQLEKGDVFQITKQEESYTVAGELWSLLMLQKRLQTLLRTGKKQSAEYKKREFCNKCVQTEKPKTTDTAVQTNYPIKKQGLVNCGTMCEILLPSVTAFGREIKQSGRYNTNSSTFLSHSVDEDMDEEYTPRTSRRKRKVPKRAATAYEHSDIKIKNDKVKQSQRIVVVQDDTVTVKDCNTKLNRSTKQPVLADTKTQMKSITNNQEIIPEPDASIHATNGKKNFNNEIGQKISIPGTNENNTMECFSTQPVIDTNLLDNYQSIGTDMEENNDLVHNYESHDNLSANTNTCNDVAFIHSEPTKSTGEVFTASASDYTSITSEDSSEENDIANGTSLLDEPNSIQNNLGSTRLNTLPQEDQIQAALRASQICFEEVPELQPSKSKTNTKKKSKKDYEAATPFKFFCDKCSFKSKRHSHLIKHLKFHETVRKMFYCKQCNYKTIRNGALRRHEMSHSSNVMHCNQCKYTTDDFISLDRHMKIKHDLAISKKKKKTIYKCPKCDYSSMMPSRYAAHLRLHKDLSGSGSSDIMLALQQFEEKPEEQQTFQCTLCSYKSIRKEHLVRHVNNVHTDHRPFLCDICGQSFKRKDALSQHKITHVDKLNRNYAFHCTVCKKPFRSKTHLNEHMAMHSNIRQYLCDICGTSFKTKSCQQKHIKSIHHNPRSFECNSCLKRFNTKFALLRHLRIHEKPTNLITTQSVSNVETVVPQIFQTLDSQPATLVQDIITTDGEVFETTEDNLQQVLLKTNDSNESATAIMYLPTSLQPGCF